MKLVIKSGLVIDPANKIQEIRDIYIKDNVIVGNVKSDTDFSEKIEFLGEDVKIIDATDKLVIPGMIDMHVHLRDPGFTYKEDIESGSKAAKNGGFSTIVAMANTKPIVDSPELVEYVLNRGKDVGLVDVMTVASITKGMEGKELTDFAQLKKSGICALSEDGKSVVSEELMFKAMAQAKDLDILIMDHTEDHSLSGGSMNEGLVSYGLKIKGIPKEAEELMVERDIKLAEKAGCRLHIQHVSTKGSVELIRKAKKRGVKVTGETAPHYFSMTEWEIVNQQIVGEKPLAKTNMKMNPPLRTKDDMMAIREGLKDGTIDAIATDHAPHSEGDKALPFEEAPFGIVGLETSFAVSYTNLVETGCLTVSQLVEKMSLNPAKILGIDKGTLSVGAKAEFVIIDVGEEYEIDPSQFVSKAENTPFAGLKVFGKVGRL